MTWTGDICDDTLNQIHVFGASYIVTMGDCETNFLMDYHSALSEAEMLHFDTGLTDFAVCRLTIGLDGEVDQTIWDGHVVDGKATAFLRQNPGTNVNIL